MKGLPVRSKLGLVSLVVLFAAGGNVCAAEYDIDSFSDSDTSLKNHNPAIIDGDILHLKNNLTADQNLQTLGSITIDAANHIISGNSLYSGFETTDTETLNIYNFKGISDFKAQNGAAVNNAGTVNIKNSTFSNNSSAEKGGAIYNSGIVNISTENGITSFKSNTANGASNAIYNDGSVNIQSDKYGYVKFDDKISSSDTSKTININTDGLTLGTVIFNDTIENSTVNLGAGTLKLGYNSQNSSVKYFENSKLNITGGTLHTANAEIDTISLSDLSRQIRQTYYLTRI